MARKRLVYIGSALAALAVIASGSASAQQPLDRRTFFTFSAPVDVPGTTLPAGRYLFRVANTNASHDVIQVLSADGREPLALFHAVPAQRPTPSLQPGVSFKETPEGTPAAVSTWWHPGLRLGHEFIYPRRQALTLARNTQQPVLAAVADAPAAAAEPPAALARIQPSGEEARVDIQAVPADAVVGRELQGEAAPSTIAIPESVLARAARADGQQARAELPRTASRIPLVALAGLGLLALAGALRLRRAGA
jgi:hypothetical protein